MKQKLFTFFLALVASVGAIYASYIEVDGIWYNFNKSNKTATVTYRGSSYDDYSDEYSGTVVIPSSVTYNGITYSVTSIEERAFYKCSSLTSVTIGNSVTSIGVWAFKECSSLTSVTIGNSVTSIGDVAFAGCSSLTSVTIPNSVTSIGATAFHGCRSLTSVTFPESVTSIGNSAFYGCRSLTSVTIPSSVTSIGHYVFSGCSSLTSVTIPESVTSIGKSAFEGCSAIDSIVWNAKNCADASASEDAPFYAIRSQITSFTFGENVEHIPAYLCDGMDKLTSVTIPNSVTSIGKSAFEGCSSLNFITCEAATPPTTVGSYVFYGVSKSIPVYVPCECVEAYKAASGWKAFTNIQGPQAEYSITVDVNDTIMGSAKVDKNTICDAAHISATPNIGYHFVQWRDGVTDNPRTLELTQDTILTAEFAQSFSGQCGDSLYWELFDTTLQITGKGEMYNYKSNTIPWKLLVSSIKSLSVSEGTTSIGEYAFDGCNNITSVTWNAKNCNTYNFGSQVTSFEFGNEVEVVPSSLCKGMEKLTSVTIPNSVKTIGTSAFEGCARLGKISLGTGLEEIAANAFAGCTRLYDIYCHAVYPPFVDESSFANYNAYLYIPCDSKRDYTLDPVWGKFQNIECLSDEPTDMENIETPSQRPTNCQKLLRNGQLIILRDGVEYNALGQEM